MTSNSSKSVSLLMMVFCAVLSSSAQNSSVTLRIGDAAPAIKYSKWISGTPVESFTGDQLYILEFWATWCGPCRAAMPHLTKLQKQYEGKISIIGVDVWEDKKKGQPYEAFLPIVEKFVRENKANMGYAVVADNNDQHMGTNWLKAAGQEGIPSTFIVKDEKIVWIGNPLSLDSILPQILDGRYDAIVYKQTVDREVEDSKKLVAEWLAATKPVQEALTAKNYKKALANIDTAKSTHPELRFALSRMKFSILLSHVNQQEAINFGEIWKKEDKNAAGAMLDAVTREDNLLITTYLWVATSYEDAGVEISPFSFHELASAYGKGGDLKNAVRYEEKAVNSAEDALEKSATGAMTQEILKTYKEALAHYKQTIVQTGGE